MRTLAAQWISEHQNELIDDIRTLVLIPSVSSTATDDAPYGADCLRALKQFLRIGERYGFAVTNHENHCGSIWQGRGTGTVGLWGHLDVVPAGENWIYPPFACTQQGDFLIGRGTQDNKGPAILGLYLLRFFEETNTALPFRLQVIGGCDEENGMNDISHYLVHNTPPDYSLVLDASFPVCHGEKGLTEIVLRSAPLTENILLESGDVSNKIPDHAYLSMCANPIYQAWGHTLPAFLSYDIVGNTLTVHSTGRSGHVAFPEHSINAIFPLATALSSAPVPKSDQRSAALLAAVTKDGFGTGLGINQEDEISGRLTCSGSVLRTVSKRLELTLNIRYPITANFSEIISQIKKETEAYGFTVEVLRNRPPHYIDPTLPWVQILQKSYQTITGNMTLPYTMGGGTYAGQLPNAVAFGPGLSADLSPLALPPDHGGVHGPDEAQSISNLLTAFPIYVEALVQLGNFIQTKDGAL